MLNSDRLLDLTTVVVNWNSGGCLATLLDSIQGLRPELTGTLVVDNGSEDGSADAALGREGVRLVRAGRNLGFAGAANLGIASSDSRYILLLNPDVTVFPAAIPGLCRVLEGNPRVAIVAGELLDSRGSSQADFQFRPLPTFRGVIRDALFLDELFAWARPRKTTAPVAGPVEQPAAAFWLLRRAAWLDLEGFDERFYPAWFEDVDFCRRGRDRGWEAHFVPVPCGLHQGGSSLARLGRRRFLSIYYGNLLVYWRKHHPRSLLPVWMAVRLGVGLRRMVSRS